MSMDKVKRKIFQILWPFGSLCYSQEGEDMVLNRVFGGKSNGFFVDVGAHHPKRFSNTYFFYKSGWRGINIDAMPGSMDAFKRARPLDTNIEVPVSDTNEVLTYYIFNEPALNGFSKELSDSRDNLRDYKIIDTKELKTRTLADILDEFLPQGQAIDFLSIDVEGLDFQVLRSNNWDKYQPDIVLLEVLGSTLNQIMTSETTQYMENLGYAIFAKTFNTVFFKKVN